MGRVMKNVKNKKRNGVTLIELIIALAIMSIVTGLIFVFYFTNQKKISEIEIKSDLQYEAKTVLDNISKVAMESTGAKWNGASNELVFSHIDISESGKTSISEVKYKIDESTNEISLIQGKTSTLLSNHFKNIGIEELVDDEVINDKIKLELTLENKGITYKVEENYVFRNSHLK